MNQKAFKVTLFQSRWKAFWNGIEGTVDITDDAITMNNRNGQLVEGWKKGYVSIKASPWSGVATLQNSDGSTQRLLVSFNISWQLIATACAIGLVPPMVDYFNGSKHQLGLWAVYAVIIFVLQAFQQRQYLKFRSTLKYYGYLDSTSTTKLSSASARKG